jgi:hypothetical protein
MKTIIAASIIMLFAQIWADACTGIMLIYPTSLCVEN